MLRDSDPRLVALFSIFTRLTWDEEMPRIEEDPGQAGPVRRLARLAHASQSGGASPARPPVG